MRNYFLLFVSIGVLKSTLGFSQDLTIKIEIKDSIQSKILSGNRPVVVNLPKDYEISNIKRARDMIPLSTPTCEVKNPATENFFSFIGNDLIPISRKTIPQMVKGLFMAGP